MISRRLTLAALTIALIGHPREATAQSEQGPTAKLSVGKHVEVGYVFSIADAQRLLADAVKRVRDINVHNDDNSGCEDHSVSCSDITTTQSDDIPWGVEGDGNVNFQRASDDAVKAWLAANPSPQVKIVKSIESGQSFEEGMTLQGYFNSLIAVYTDNFESDLVGGDTWAHEIGHMSGLGHNSSCKHGIMNELTVFERDQLSADEANTYWGGLFELGQATNDGNTALCQATSAVFPEDEVAIASSRGVTVSFTATWDTNTGWFEVVRVDPSSGDSLYSAGRAEQVYSESGRYAAVDPNGVVGAEYVVREHQVSGGDLLYLPVLAVDGSVTYDEVYDSDPVQGVTGGGPSDPPPNPCTNIHFLYGAPEYEILCPDSLADTLRVYAGLWSQHGVYTSIVTKTMADTCSGSYKEWIRHAASTGTRYFLLVGDANDHALWDDSTRWTNGWRYPGFTSNGIFYHEPSQPSKDVIPTFYETVSGPPGWTAFTPYFATDLPYADVDDDSLPDVIVGRLPVSNKTEIAAYTQKLSTWFTSTNGQIGSNAALLTFAGRHGGVPAWPTAFAADTLRLAMGASTNVTQAGYFLYGPVAYYTQQMSDSLQSIANAAAAGGADVIVWNLNSSDRYNYSGFWTTDYAWISPAPGPTNRPFISVGLSCGMNNFDETEQQSFNGMGGWYGAETPIVERLLFNPTHGAIAQIAPTRGSFQDANPLFGAEFLRRLYAPGNSVGRAFLLAQRQCMLNYPQYKQFFKSYSLLGDPRIGVNQVTGAYVDPEKPVTRFLRAAPNPFNPETRLRLFLARPGTVSIEVFDARGRLVKRLVSGTRLSAGWGEVRWDGKNVAGSNVASGVYFARMRTQGFIGVQRLVLLR